MTQRVWIWADELGIVHIMLVLQAYRIQEQCGHGGFHQDFKGRPQSIGSAQYLHGDIGSQNVNLKLQWRPQSAGDARNGIFTRESQSDWNQPKREACKLQKAVQAPLCTADRYGAISFNAFHAQLGLAWSNPNA